TGLFRFRRGVLHAQNRASHAKPPSRAWFPLRYIHVYITRAFLHLGALMRLSLIKRLSALFFLLCSMAQAGEVTVSAASSLTNAFQEVARAYEAEHAGATVLLNFGASGALLQQMTKGAPVDVFASDEQKTMDIAAESQLNETGNRQEFARKTL